VQIVAGQKVQGEDNDAQLNYARHP